MFSRKTWGKKFREYPGVKLVFILGRDPDSAVHVIVATDGVIDYIYDCCVFRKLSQQRLRTTTTSSWRISTTRISTSH